MEEKLLKVAEFAAKAGVSTGTIYTMIAATRKNKGNGQIKFVEHQRRLKPLILIPESELSKFGRVTHEG